MFPQISEESEESLNLNNPEENGSIHSKYNVVSNHLIFFNDCYVLW